MKVGFIGLGNMGKPLAERLLKNNELFVHDLDQENLEYFKIMGATACSTPSKKRHYYLLLYLKGEQNALLHLLN